MLFVGYQANGTLGRNIVDGARHVTIFGEQIDVKAEIASLPGMSGHADRDGLEAWLHNMAKKPDKVFVVHGDENVAPLFASRLASEGYNACAPRLFERYDLAARLPQQEEAVFIDRNEKIIKAAYENLEAEKKKLEKLVSRFQFAVSAVDRKDQKRCVRLANALERLASDFEDLGKKWNSDPD